MLRQHKDISDPGKRRVVGDDTSETDLLIAFVNSKRQRVFDRSLNDIAAAAFAPVRMIAEVVVNQIEVQTRPICADRVVAAVPRVKLPLPLGEGCGEGFSGIHFLFSSSLRY